MASPPLQDVSFDDVSRVIRLVQEVCDRWDDPRLWREYLLHGACGLLNGHAGMLLAQYGGEGGNFGRLVPIAIVGLPEPARRQIEAHVSQVEGQPMDKPGASGPGFQPLRERFIRQGWVTVARDELTDAASYHASDEYLKFRRPLNLDDCVISLRWVDIPERVEAMNIDRPHGAPPFGPREVALLKLLHDEIAPLIGVRLATEEHLCRDGLSRRLRETLNLLLEGKSEKEAAAAMKLSAGTVHDYVTALYQHFQVASRSELLAYFIRRQPVPRDPSV